MIVYEVATKELDTKYFPQHTIADLISGIIVQSGEAFTVEGNKHTHTRFFKNTLKQPYVATNYKKLLIGSTGLWRETMTSTSILKNTVKAWNYNIIEPR